MERHVKERLVGAAVLVAAAILLIPEMLSGPNRDSRSAVETTDAPAGEAPLKTYTIDLSKSPAAVAAESAIDNRAPPAEMPATAAEPVPAAQATPDSSSPAVEALSAGSTTKPETPADQPAPPSRQPAVEATPTPDASVPASASDDTNSRAPAVAGATGGGWAVQLGSFASRVTAERMMKGLQSDGHAAFVMPVKSGQATLYRVRIGPMKDRESAAQTLRKIKASTPGATVVAHP